MSSILIDLALLIFAIVCSYHDATWITGWMFGGSLMALYCDIRRAITEAAHMERYREIREHAESAAVHLRIR